MKIKWTGPLILLVASASIWSLHFFSRPVSQKKIRNSLTEKFFSTEENSFSFKVNDELLEAKTTFNSELNKYALKLLKRFKTPFSAFAIIDNNSGKIIAAGGRDRITDRESRNLAFSTTHPAASLAKIITSSALFEYSSVNPDSVFSFNGRGTTLYKYQLKDKKSKWTRNIRFERAFNYSNNVVFGKAGIRNLKAGNLLKMANNYGFNSDFISDIYVPHSKFDFPESQYQLAEFSSGFNKKTTISVVHAAYLSFLVTNNGEKLPLYSLESLKNENGEDVLVRKNSSVNGKAMSAESSVYVSKMMKSTVRKGTARGSFSRMRKNLHKKLVIGAKTGSITGGFPHGKHEWITVFARPKDSDDKGISVAVLNINKEKWYVRSGFIAKKLIEYYFNNIRQEEWKKVTQN